MTQYFFVDESGDPGLEGWAGSSSHFVVAMVQLPDRTPLHPLIRVRKALGLAPTFEFKYYSTAAAPKERFFWEVLSIPFRVRAVIVDKQQLPFNWRNLSPKELMTQLLIHLTFRASELDIANEILIIDGATPAFCRNLRVQFTDQCKRQRRIRPFKNIVGANSRNEDGLQLADMIAGAIRLHGMDIDSEHYFCISARIVDLWELG
jgi:Protein of unknown function (DUF3800)